MKKSQRKSKLLARRRLLRQARQQAKKELRLTLDDWFNPWSPIDYDARQWADQ